MVDTIDDEVTPPARMKQAEYARYRGCSRQHISRLVNDDKIPVDRDGLVLVASVDEILGPPSNGIKEWRCVIDGEEIGLKPGSDLVGNWCYFDDWMASLKHRNRVWAYEVKRLRRYAPHFTNAALEGGEPLVTALLETLISHLERDLNRLLDEMYDEFLTDGMTVTKPPA